MGDIISIKDTRAALEEHPLLGSLIGHSRYNAENGLTVTDDAGVHSTLSLGIDDERINGGKPSLIPTVWDGEILEQEDAVKRAVASGKEWPSFKDHTESTKYSKIASNIMGTFGAKEKE
jgi:hypothetical protein